MAESKVPLGKVVIIAAAVGALALAFAYTAGWLSPHRLTPGTLLTALVPPPGPAVGHRRHHAPGAGVTGTCEATGNGVEISKARVFERGQSPVVGRRNIAGSDPA